MKISCIAVDDEPLALDQIARYINRIPGLRLLGTFLTVSQAREFLAAAHVDLVFLDIEMPGVGGMEFARSLRSEESAGGPEVIFTTAWPDYAVEGYRVDAVDYLLKPLSMDELEEAVDKVSRRLRARHSATTETADAPRSTIHVKVKGMIKNVAIDDILFVKGLGEYVRLTVKGETLPLTVHDSIKHLESTFPADRFMRVHKSYFINLDHIDSASRERVVIGGVEIPVGEKYRKAFYAYLREGKK